MPVKLGVALCTCLALTLVSQRHARAEGDEKQACVEAHEQGQLLRNDGRLRDARERFLQCARPSCPAIVVRDCGQWEQEVMDSQPTVVIAAQDPEGRDITDVRVSVDGALLTERLGAKAYDVDPGPHTFRFEAPGSPPHEEHLMLRVGEKNRRLSIRFGKPDKQPSSSLPAGALVAGGGAAVGLAVFATFGILGRVKQVSLNNAHCAPNCLAGDIDVAYREYVVSDIGLTVGVVSAEILIWTLVLRSHPHPPVGFDGRSLEFAF
jgi:hypothetical protein